ncbi:hypothetical protein CSC94_15970 [Zhengella mangrovi]|uniref:Addiction module toxin RelE n=1 Tax=Zhengella mangrovi TaxID=1982044 RepID=A0A2G1QKN1_9HYPH|nr:hypothetical protein [Zhengella mangrovi]PHP66095.1 hypothetical protein CSC94_15970 [Zhengella mangrovi]
MTLRIEIAETDRFRLDCAMYGLDDAVKARKLDQLRADPVIGVQKPGQSRLWEWQSAGFVFSYLLADDLSRLVLVELRPKSAPETGLTERFWIWVDRIGKLKRLFGV